MYKNKGRSYCGQANPPRREFRYCQFGFRNYLLSFNFCLFVHRSIVYRCSRGCRGLYRYSGRQFRQAQRLFRRAAYRRNNRILGRCCTRCSALLQATICFHALSLATKKNGLRRSFCLSINPLACAVLPHYRGSSRGQSPPRIGSNAALSLAMQGVRGAKRIFLCRFAARK